MYPEKTGSLADAHLGGATCLISVGAYGHPTKESIKIFVHLPTDKGKRPRHKQDDGMMKPRLTPRQKGNGDFLVLKALTGS